MSLDQEIADHAITQAAAQVEVLKPEPGDIVIAKLGIMDMGDGLPPWIPTPHELASLRDDLERVLPDGVRLLVHHFGINFEIVRDVELAEVVQVTAIPEEPDAV